MLKLSAYAGALIYALLAATAVFAQDAPANTTVALLPWYTALEPYILTAFGVVFATLFGWLCQQFSVRTGIHVTDQAKASVQQAALNAAGRILASQEGNVANLKFDVRSPLVAAEVPKLLVSVKDEINTLGMTPDRVADLIQGKIGQLQAASTVAPVVIPSAGPFPTMTPSPNAPASFLAARGGGQP